MMRVYFVRHGERADRLYNDSIFAKRDIPLTENGKHQAALLAERFAAMPIDLIYSSPYVRTRETTEILNATLKAEVRYEELIEELGFDEPVSSVFKRANKFVELLTSENKGSVMVSAHAGIIKMIVFAMVFGEVHLGEPFRKFDASFHMDFTGITSCKLEEDGTWRIVTWNDLGHLPPPL